MKNYIEIFINKMIKKYLLSPLFTPIVTILSCSIFLNIIYIIFPYSVPRISEEGQLIDILTYSGYIVLLFSLILSFKNFKEKMFDYCIYIFLAICALLREMGAQHWLTNTDSTAIKIKFFTNPNNPISEKIISGFVILIVLLSILYLIRKYTIYLIKNFFKMDIISWSVGTLIFWGLFGKFIDRFPSNFKKEHGEALMLVIKDNLSILEETSEIFLPITVIIILIQYNFIRKQLKKD